MKHCLRHAGLAVVLAVALVAPSPATYADYGRWLHAAQNDRQPKPSAQLTAKEAAARARAQYGGKVLKVMRAGDNAFKVRLLQDSGRVLTVTIRG
jgi:uncharacterized membrane protein YkoI